MAGYAPKGLAGVGYRLERKSKAYLQREERARRVFHVKGGFLIALFANHSRIVECARPANQGRARRRLQSFPLPRGWRADLHTWPIGHPPGHAPKIEIIARGGRTT